jgi:hypothetical protein
MAGILLLGIPVMLSEGKDFWILVAVWRVKTTRD